MIRISKKPRRLPLREWADLDDIRQKMDAGIEKGDVVGVSELILKTIEACGVKAKSNAPWFYTVQIYSECLLENAPRKKFPILMSKEKSKKMPWEYEGRTWYFWLNMFADRYGWSEDQIGRLDIDDAIGLYQEILVERQIRDEFEWGLHEVAYEYIPATKKSKYRPLPRPDWMVQYAPGEKKPVKKTKILKAMMPVGNIETID